MSEVANIGRAFCAEANTYSTSRVANLPMFAFGKP